MRALLLVLFVAVSSQTASQTMSPSRTQTPSRTLSRTQTPSQTETPTQSPSYTQTPTYSPTPSQTPSRSSSVTATQTSSPSPTYAYCIGGTCEDVSYIPAWPRTYAGTTVAPVSGAPSPRAVVVAWPSVYSSFQLILSSNPAPDEDIRVACNSTDERVLLAVSNASCPEFGGRRCLLPAEGLFNFSYDLRSEFYVVAAAPYNYALLNSSATAAEIHCTVSAGRAVFPNRRFADKTRVTVPVRVLSSLWTRLDGIITESAATPGLFTASSTGQNVSITDCVAASSQLKWNSPSISENDVCVSRLETTVVNSLLDPSFFNSPRAPPLMLTMGSSTHMLLVADDTRFPTSGLSVSFRRADGSFIFAKPNYVSPSGTFASVTTPNVTEICGSLVQCFSQIILSTDSAYETTRAALVNASTSVDFPDNSLRLSTACPPLIPRYYFDSELLNETSRGTIKGTVGAFADLARYSFFDTNNGTFNDGVAFNASFTTSGGYIQFVSGVCIDLALLFRAQNYTFAKLLAVPELRGGVWGEAADCRVCDDTTGADCPGGAVLLPRENYWAPSVSSPLDTVRMCDAPAAARCPGWRSICGALKDNTLGACKVELIRTGGCSTGYKGTACQQCSEGHFASYSLNDELSCKPCQSLSQTLDSFKAVGVFASVLLVCILALIYFTRLFLECSTLKAALAASELGAWTWMALQSTGAIMRVTQKFAPKELGVFFTLLTSLQVVGITDALPCPLFPFTDTWAAVIVSALLLVVGTIALLLSVRHVRTRPTLDIPQQAAAAPPFKAFLVLQFACNTVFFLYGPLASALSNVLLCSKEKSRDLSVYLSLKQEGAAMLPLISSNSSYTSLLVAANLTVDTAYVVLSNVAKDPAQLSSFPLLRQTLVESALKTQVTFSTVASAPSYVCFEGAHKEAWYAAVFTSIIVLFGSVALGLWIFVDRAVIFGIAVEARACCARTASCSLQQQPQRTLSCFRLHPARAQPSLVLVNPLHAHRLTVDQASSARGTPPEKVSARSLLATPPSARVSSRSLTSSRKAASARAVLSAALTFEGVREGAESFTFIILAALGAFTFISSVALREVDSVTFTRLMTVSGLLALSLALLAHYWAPYNSFMIWKNDGLTLLYLLSAASSGLSVFMFQKANKASSNADDANRVPSLSSGEVLPYFILLTIVVIVSIFVFIARQWLIVTRRVLGEKKRLRDFEADAGLRIASAHASVGAVESIISSLPLPLTTVIFEREQARARAAYERRVETDAVVSAAAEFIMNEMFHMIDQRHFSARTAVFVGAAALVRQSAVRLIQGAASERGPGAGQRIADTVWSASRLEHFACVLESIAGVIDKVDETMMTNIGSCFFAAAGILEEIADGGPLGASDFHLRKNAAAIREVARAKCWLSAPLAIPEWRARLYGDTDYLRVVFPLIAAPQRVTDASGMPEPARTAYERAELESAIALKEAEVEAAVAKRAAEVAARAAYDAAQVAARERLRHGLEAAVAKEISEAAARRETSRAAAVEMAPQRALAIHHDTGGVVWVEFSRGPEVERTWT